MAFTGSVPLSYHLQQDTSGDMPFVSLFLHCGVDGRRLNMFRERSEPDEIDTILQTELRSHSDQAVTDPCHRVNLVQNSSSVGKMDNSVRGITVGPI